MSLKERRRSLSIAARFLAPALLGASSALLGTCGPFVDVAGDSFCPLVLEIFTLGITTGTTVTTYDPTAAVNRLQMAVFLSRTVDGVLKRGSRRAALNQTWPTETNANLALTTVGTFPNRLVSDGVDIWVSNLQSNSLSRVRASDGALLQTWTGATSAAGILWTLGRVFASSNTNPGRLYRVDGSQPAGVVTTLATTLGSGAVGMTYDGSRIWTSNADGTVSIVTPSATVPWTVTNVAVGTGLAAAVYDGSNVWVTDGQSGSAAFKLNSAGAILQTVTVGLLPAVPVFDGANIWIPNLGGNSVSVLRASNGTVLGTLTGNGLNSPLVAAFDGQRILVTNIEPGADVVSLWKAADLTAIGSFPTGPGTKPRGACSDGINFWISLNGGVIARF